MSIESAKAFIKRMKTDEEFRNQMIAAEDKKAPAALVKSGGFDFTGEDICRAIGELSKGLLDERWLRWVCMMGGGRGKGVRGRKRVTLLERVWLHPQACGRLVTNCEQGVIRHSDPRQVKPTISPFSRANLKLRYIMDIIGK